MLCKDLLNIKGKGLLLVCCGPCCSGVVDYIANNNLDITLFFYNPNIYPYEEYIHRKEQVIKLADVYGLKFIDTDYDTDDYYSKIKGFENCKERGERCGICFKLRLLKAANYAKNNGYDYFTSTLGFSRWKDLNQVDSAGFEVEKEVNFKYFDVNWRKCGIQDKAREVIKKYNLYEQNYCGCVYSMKNRKSSDVDV